MGIGTDFLRLVSEAYRINLAWLFDPYVAITTSIIEPEPVQRPPFPRCEAGGTLAYFGHHGNVCDSSRRRLTQDIPGDDNLEDL
jgi:hypothetical protein